MEFSEILNFILGGGLLASLVGIVTLRATVRKANAEAEEGTPFMMYRYPVVIADVQPGMGAKKAGLQKLDKVVAVDTVKASTYTEFTAELNKYAGKTVPVTVLPWLMTA